jgi:hypothetical protein
MTDDTNARPAAPEDEPSRPQQLTPQAQRALAEAEERRRVREAETTGTPRELGGQEGPEPTRYGDWEKAGIVSDF